MLLEALERIHSKVKLEDFYQNAFAALQPIFKDAFIVAQEFNTRTAQARSESNSPAPPGLFERCAELIPLEHPIYQAIQSGAEGALRLSDFRSVRQLQATAFFNEIFSPLGVRNEIVLPIRLQDHVAGFTISRREDFTDAEVTMASMLAPHLALAHIHAQTLSALSETPAEVIPLPEKLRVNGITERESEVLYWMILGKRNAEIAVIQKTSPRTIAKQAQNIFSKLSVETRTAAASEALRLSRQGTDKRTQR